jgi:hypothetical protein
MRDLRNGKISGVLNIPPEFSRKVLAGTNPRSRWWKTTPTNSPPPPWKDRSTNAGAYNQPPVPAAPERQRHALGRRGLSLRALHPVFAAGHHCAGHFCLGHDRRRHHFH